LADYIRLESADRPPLGLESPHSLYPAWKLSRRAWCLLFSPKAAVKNAGLDSVAMSAVGIRASSIRSASRPATGSGSL